MMMARESILFYDVSIVNRRDAFRVLAATGAACIVAETLESLSAAFASHGFSILITDISGYRHLHNQGHDLSDTRTIILSAERFEQVYAALNHAENCTYFIAKNIDGQLPLRDLQVTISKLAHIDIFGVDKYLNWGARRMVFHLRDSSTRAEYINEALGFCQDIRLRKRQINSVHRLCEEMLMNAFYDAPRDEHGREIYQGQCRTEKVILSPSHSARLELASDGERLAVSVSDAFGAISRKTILHYLSKNFADIRQLSPASEKKGAGIGLYLCFKSVSSLIINIAPGIRTEFIGLIDLNTEMKDPNYQHPSFHYFSTNDRALQLTGS